MKDTISSYIQIVVNIGIRKWEQIAQLVPLQN
jgi:hypothetical protein